MENVHPSLKGEGNFISYPHSSKVTCMSQRGHICTSQLGIHLENEIFNLFLWVTTLSVDKVRA